MTRGTGSVARFKKNLKEDFLTGCLRGHCVERKQNGERAAVADLAAYIDATMVVFHNAAREG